MRNKKILVVAITVMLLSMSTGCAKIQETIDGFKKDKEGVVDVAGGARSYTHIKVDTNKSYEEKFKESEYRTIFGFDYEHPTEERLLTMELIGYKNGKKYGKKPLATYSYTLNPGGPGVRNVGMAMESKDQDGIDVVFYTSESDWSYLELDETFFKGMGPRMVDYSVNETFQKINYGQNIIVGVIMAPKIEMSKKDTETMENLGDRKLDYVATEEYDFKNIEDIDRMIQKEESVILLTIKIQ